MIEIGVICLLFWGGAPGPASPRIERLRAEAARDPQAEERFWEEMERRGAPLIEPAAERGESLVTFVYRGGRTPERWSCSGTGRRERRPRIS